jgi:hypothetical protein
MLKVRWLNESGAPGAAARNVGEATVSVKNVSVQGETVVFLNYQDYPVLVLPAHRLIDAVQVTDV